MNMRKLLSFILMRITPPLNIGLSLLGNVAIMSLIEMGTNTKFSKLIHAKLK